MRTHLPVALAPVAVVLGLTGLVGCGDPAGPGTPKPPGAAAPFTLPVGSPAYDPEAPAWAVGGTVHVGETTLELDPAPSAFVVTASGVYYLADETLWFSDGGEPERVARVGTTTLVLSPDRRHLGLMDQARGPVDPFDTHLATPVVLDVTTGEQVLREPAGDELDDQDLMDLYEDAPMGFLGFDEQAAYVEDPVAGGTLRLPLDGSEPEQLADRAVPLLVGTRGTPVSTARTRDGGVRVVRDGGASNGAGWLSPDGDALLPAEPSRGVWYSPDAGTPHPLETGERLFHLGGWVDDDTFYGAASTGGSIMGPTGRTLVVTCTLGRPRCTPVSEELTVTRRPALLFDNGRSSLAG